MFVEPYRSRTVRSRVGVLGPWVHGVHRPQTSHGFLQATELSDAVNVYTLRGGILATRPPMRPIVEGLGGPVRTLYAPQVGRVLLAVVEGVGLVRIDVDTGAVTTVSTLIDSTATTFFEFKDRIVICDGGHLKLLDPATWSVSMAWDEGAEGMMHSGARNVPDGSVALYSGSVTRVAARIRTPQWEPLFTIPPRKVTAMLGANGSPSGQVYARVRAVATDAVIAENVLCNATDPPTVGYAEFSIHLNATGHMNPDTEYYVSIEYSGGNSTNYVRVGTVTSSTPNTYTYTTSWTPAGTETCVSLYPALPPKAKFGCVWNGRPWVAGSDDSPGRVYYGNLSLYDWSTPGGGGYIGMIDDSAATFPVGGMGPAFDSLFVFGTSTAPYMSRIHGPTPSEYVQSVLQFSGQASARTVAPVVNDLWVASGDAVWRVSGVQEFGDVRAHSESDSIKGALNNVSELTYYPELGAVVALDGGKIWVCNALAPVQDPATGRVRYPWTAWEIYDSDLTDPFNFKWIDKPDGIRYVTTLTGGAPFIEAPDAVATLWKGLESVSEYSALYSSAFYVGDVDGLGFDTVYVASGYQQKHMLCTVVVPTTVHCAHERMYIGTDNGRIYASDDTFSERMYPRIRTGIISPPSYSVLLQNIIPDIHCRAGGDALVEIYLSLDTDPHITYTQPIIGVMLDSIVDNMNMPIDAAGYAISLPSVGSSVFRVHSHATQFRLGVVMLEFFNVSTSIRSIRYTYRPLRY